MCWGGPPALSVIFVNQAAIQLQEVRNALTAVRDLILQNLERQNVIYVQWGDIRCMQQMTNVVSAIAEVTHQGKACHLAHPAFLEPTLHNQLQLNATNARPEVFNPRMGNAPVIAVRSTHTYRMARLSAFPAKRMRLLPYVQINVI